MAPSTETRVRYIVQERRSRSKGNPGLWRYSNDFTDLDQARASVEAWASDTFEARIVQETTVVTRSVVS